MFMSESGFNTPYIDYSEHFSSSDNNRGYDIHAWNIYLSDSNDKRTNTAFTAAYRYGYEQLGYLDRDKGADGEGSGGTIASNAEVHPWMTSGSNKFFHYDPQSKDPNEGLQGSGNSWYLQDWSTSNSDRSYNNGTSMKVFLGREKAIDAIKDNFSVEYDQITVMGRKIEYICPGVTITVKRGGVLTVDGALINDGKIVVEDGGLMAIKKDAVIMPLFFNKSDRGGITSSGNIIIRSGGAMIGGGSNGIYLSGGTVVNLGIMASENFTIKRDYTIENKSSGQIYVGKTINGTLVSRMISDIDSGKLGNSFKVSDITEDTLHNYLSSVRVSVPSNPTYGNGTYKRF